MNIIEAVKYMRRTGKPITVKIHQPYMAYFKMCRDDNVMMLYPADNKISATVNWVCTHEKFMEIGMFSQFKVYEENRIH